MKVAFLGNGPVAKSIGAMALAAGHGVVFGMRDPAKDVEAPFRKATFAVAASEADLVIIALKFEALDEVLPGLAEILAGKVVVDATNPVHADWSPVLLGEEWSGGEKVGELLPRSQVVKTFNTVFADVMRPDRLDREGQKVTLLLCGDGASAKTTVAGFASQIGFAPIDAGRLKMSRYLEAMAHLNVGLAVAQGGGTNAAFLYHRAG